LDQANILTQRKIWIRTAQIPMAALSGHSAERSNRKVIVQRRTDCAFVFPALCLVLG
jgi:hypothetical protein